MPFIFHRNHELEQSSSEYGGIFVEMLNTQLASRGILPRLMLGDPSKPHDDQDWRNVRWQALTLTEGRQEKVTYKIPVES
jgi:hypothetical protein